MRRHWTVKFCCRLVCKIRMSRNNCFFIAVNASLVFSKVSACEHIMVWSGFLWQLGHRDWGPFVSGRGVLDLHLSVRRMLVSCKSNHCCLPLFSCFHPFCTTRSSGVREPLGRYGFPCIPPVPACHQGPFN